MTLPQCTSFTDCRPRCCSDHEVWDRDVDDELDDDLDDDIAEGLAIDDPDLPK